MSKKWVAQLLRFRYCFAFAINLHRDTTVDYRTISLGPRGRMSGGKLREVRSTLYSGALTDKQHLVDVGDQNLRRYYASVACSAGRRASTGWVSLRLRLSGLAPAMQSTIHTGSTRPRRGTVTTAGKSSVRCRVVPPSYLAGTATPALCPAGRRLISDTRKRPTRRSINPPYASPAARPELIIILTPTACHPPLCPRRRSRRRQIHRGGGRTLKILICTIKENYTDPTHPLNADEAHLGARPLLLRYCVLSLETHTFIWLNAQ